MRSPTLRSLPSSRGVLLAMALLASAAAAHQIASRLASTPDPVLAWALDPLAVSAGQAVAAAALEGEAPEPANARATVERLAAVAPVRARTWSLLAEIERLEGDEERAERLTDATLALRPSDMLASLRRMDRHARGGDVGPAFADLDAFLSRYPERTELALSVVTPLLGSPEGYEALLERLRTAPLWSSQFIARIADIPDGIDLLYRTMRDLGTADMALVDPAMRRLHASGRPDLAHRLFLGTLDGEGSALSGYVHDPRFVRRPDGSLFSWRADPSPGVEISWRPAAEGASAEGGTVSVRFANQPVRRIDLVQSILLPPGRYTFRTRSTADRLRAPKGLRWRLSCADTSQVAFTLPVDIREADETESAVSFSLERPCLRGRLELGPAEVTDSFRFRYDGTLNVHEAAIERSDA